MGNNSFRMQPGVLNVMKRPWVSFPVGLLASICLLASSATALDVSGVLTSGTWGSAQSPVRVNGDITLPSGAILQIEPGVRVEFTGPYKFHVNGQLLAVGTLANRIVFTMADGLDDSLRWGGIRFVESDRGSRLHFVRIEKSWARGEWPLNCGGGVYIESCSPSITRAEIIDNRADGDGGGVYGWFSSSTLQNVVLHSNSASKFGGGVFIGYSSPNLINCTISFNSATALGGGVYAGAESRPQITNTIITHNSQSHELDGENIDAGDAYTNDFGRSQSARPTVTFSLIGLSSLTAYPGPGNIFTLDPQFISAVPPYDFHLRYSSPAIDAGDPKFSAGAEPDVLINKIDVGAYGGTDEATPSVPVIFVNFNSLNYDSIRINSTLPKEIRIENRGHFRLSITDFRFTSAAFYPDSAEGDSGLIPAYLAAPIEPGEQAKFTIFFRPTELRTYRESVTIVSSDTLFAAPVINLTGTGIEPVAVSEDTLLFARTAIGSSRLVSFFVKNRGRSPLSLEENGVQGTGFSVAVVRETIAPGDSGEVRVTFRPTLPQTYEATASFTTNDRDLFLYLLGRGFGPKFVFPDTSTTRFLGYIYFNGDTAFYPIVIRNDGDENLVISSATVDNAAAFGTLVPEGGITILPGETGEVMVFFDPPAPNQEFSATVTINSNYPTARTRILRGRGMAEPGRYVFGHVSGVWDWDANHDDYIVLDSVYIPAHERLKIEPGARILFEPGARLVADGELRAVGTPGDSISFLPRDPSGTSASRWQGIKLYQDDASRISFAVVRGSKEGITIREAAPRIEFSTISNNGDSARVAAKSKGGGFRLENSGAVINACIIEENQAALGGGIYAINSKPTIANCTIRRNYADDGAGLYLQFQTGGLLQSLIVHDNDSPAGFGAVTAIDRSAPRLVNCTIADNSGIGLRVRERALPTVINCVIWDNEAGIELQPLNGNALVSYSDVQDGVFTGTLNLSVAPAFTGSGATPYQLADGSPLIDRGNPEAMHRDYFFPPSKGTPRNDIGAYGGPLGGGWGLPEMWISLFQNPAFPQWCDVIVASETAFTSAPACSVEFTAGSMRPVALTRIDSLSYRGSVEAPAAGTIFFTAKGNVGGAIQTVGRTFDVRMATNAGGIIYVAGLEGSLELPAQSVGRNRLVIASVTEQALKPTEQFMPLSPAVEITGIGSQVTLSIPLLLLNGLDDVGSANIFKRSSGGWKSVGNRIEKGNLVAELDGDGEYALGLGVGRNVPVTLPTEISLLAAHPNPFNGGVTLEFELGIGAEVSLALYELGGRQVKVLVEGNISAGSHAIFWNAADAAGKPLPSGVYWARLEANGAVRSVKLLLVR